jgi:hypothetical protein
VSGLFLGVRDLADMISCCFDEDVACVAIPSPSEPSLNWKTPAQCVWDDAEFSQNGIELKSKIALRPIVKQHMLAAEAFFTKILKLPNAGIEELLADLALMQGTSSRRNSKRIHRLHERIESCRRTYSRRIKYAFNSGVEHRLTKFIDMHSKLAHSSFSKTMRTKEINGSHSKTVSGPDQSFDLNIP